MSYAFAALAILLYYTCVRGFFDKTRSELGRLILAGGRSTLTSFAIVAPLLLIHRGATPYTVGVAGFGLMIAAIYLPWIGADAVDGRTVRRGFRKPTDQA